MPALPYARFPMALALNAFSRLTLRLLTRWRLFLKDACAAAASITCAISRARPPGSNPGIAISQFICPQGNLLPGIELAHRNVAGIDEVGRGCLAGPVVAAAVILPTGYFLAGLTDSKLIPAKKREILDKDIRKDAIAWSLGVVWPEIIDKVNILQATLLAMSRAAAALRTKPDLLLIDGKHVIPENYFEDAPLVRHRPFRPRQKAIVRGDRSVAAISAASILAKTFRDRLMTMMAERYPGYGLEQHKGYGTKAHLDAIGRLGLCPQHRRSFRGAGKMSCPANATLLPKSTTQPA